MVTEGMVEATATTVVVGVVETEAVRTVGGATAGRAVGVAATEGRDCTGHS